MHVAPTDFLTSNGFEIARYEVIDVVGSRITVNGMEMIVVRDITQSDRTLALRNADGTPNGPRTASPCFTAQRPPAVSLARGGRGRRRPRHPGAVAAESARRGAEPNRLIPEGRGAVACGSVTE